MKIIILIIIGILPTLIHFAEDAKTIPVVGDPDKREDIFTIGVISLFTSLWFPLQFDWLAWYKIMFLQIGVHVMFFDYMIAKSMDKDITYLGGGFWDRHLKSLPPLALFFIRVALFGGSITLIVLS